MDSRVLAILGSSGSFARAAASFTYQSGGPLNAADDTFRLGGSHTALDQDWCDERGKLLLPVVFPGFSWHNLKKAFGTEAKLDQIPRLGGQFLWSQAEGSLILIAVPEPNTGILLGGLAGVLLLLHCRRASAPGRD